MYRSARPSRRPVLALIFALAAVIAVQPARASSVLFSTNGPQTVGGQQVNATATFDIEKTGDSAWTITATVLDMEQNPTDVAQLISSVQFTLGNATIPGSPTVTSSDATEVIVDRSGSPSLDFTSTIAWGWAASISTNSVLLCTVCPSGVKGDAPRELLIGDPNSDPNSPSYGKYNKADGSIAGNDPHNPFLLASGPGTIFSGWQASPSWTVSFSGLSSAPTVTAVTFGFGTTLGDNFTLNSGTLLNSTPEPASRGLLAIGILLICAGRVRIRGSRSSRRPYHYAPASRRDE